MIAVSGGIDSGNNVLSSMEFLSLENMKDGWKEGPALPMPRKSHFMFCVRGCVFVFAGKTQMEDVISECHMYNCGSAEWMDGPVLKGPFRPLDAVLCLNRYILVVGGATKDNKMTKDAWVLDTKPWVDWSATGDPNQKPITAWAQGPAFPQPATLPNLCEIPSTAMKNGEGWVVSVGSHATGNVICGFRLPSVVDHALDWSKLQWRKMGATRDVITFCKSCVVDGVLALIGGEHFSTSKMLDLVHFRKLDLGATEGMPPIRGVSNIEQQEFNFFLSSGM